MAAESMAQQEVKLTDEDIYQAVLDKIETLNDVRETHPSLAIRVHEGVVALSGTVASSITHRLLVRSAKEIDGVQNVVDYLVDDQSICIAIATELAAHPTFKALKTPVRVASYLGAVVLSGPQVSQADAELAEQISRGVPGVKFVTNLLH